MTSSSGTSTSPTASRLRVERDQVGRSLNGGGRRSQRSLPWRDTSLPIMRSVPGRGRSRPRGPRPHFARPSKDPHTPPGRVEATLGLIVVSPSSGLRPTVVRPIGGGVRRFSLKRCDAMRCVDVAVLWGDRQLRSGSSSARACRSSSRSAKSTKGWTHEPANAQHPDDDYPVDYVG